MSENRIRSRFTTGLEYKLVITSCLIGILAISLMIALIVVASQKSSIQSNLSSSKSSLESCLNNHDQQSWCSSPTTVCSTQRCQAVADEFHSDLDTSVDPCEDFYSYTCGGWIQKNPIKQTGLEISKIWLNERRITSQIIGLLESKSNPSKSEAIEKSIDFYESCRNHKLRSSFDVKKITDFIQNVIPDGWPLLKDTWSDTTFYPIRSIVLLNQYNIRGRILQFSLRNHGEAVAKIKNVIGISSSFGDFHKSDSVENRQAYQKLILDVTKVVTKTQGDLTDSQLDQIKSLLSFEETLNELRTSDSSMIFSTLDKLKTLHTAIPASDWDMVFTELKVKEKLEKEPDQDILIQNNNLLTQTLELITKTDRKVMANYLGWRLIMFLAPFTSLELKDIMFRYENQTIHHVPQQAELNATCAELTTTLLPYAVGKQFIDDFEEREMEEYTAYEQIQNMVREAKGSFRVLLTKNQWIDEVTKEKASDKLWQIKTQLLYPSWINRNNKDDLDQFYQEVKVDKSDLMTSITNIYSWLSDKSFAEFKEIPDHYNWDRSPTSPNAFYVNSWNMMVIPIGAMFPPFYEAGRLAPLNYGSLGFLVGHELIHAFDRVGQRFDSYGIYSGPTETWWSKNMTEGFRERSKCFKAQFEKFDLNGKKLNPDATMTENIADSTGLNIAYQAFKIYVAKFGGVRLPNQMSNYTPEQLFFLSFASTWCSSYRDSYVDRVLEDKHSPYKFRAIASLQNNHNFAAAFKCNNNSFMNPVNKCIIW